MSHKKKDFEFAKFHITCLYVFKVGQDNQFTLQNMLQLSDFEYYGSKCFSNTNHCYHIKKNDKTTMVFIQFKDRKYSLVEYELSTDQINQQLSFGKNVKSEDGKLLGNLIDM